MKEGVAHRSNLSSAAALSFSPADHLGVIRRCHDGRLLSTYQLFTLDTKLDGMSFAGGRGMGIASVIISAMAGGMNRAAGVRRRSRDGMVI